MSNIHVHKHSISRDQRSAQKGHKPFVVWFTGLSGSGKSTLANAVEVRLHELGVHSYILDGDNIRSGLCKDLGFSDTDRVENIRRIGEVSKLLVDAGVVTLSAFISPFRADRQIVRSLLGQGEMIEVYVKCALAECEKRDPKGLYKKARDGIIPNFTGIDSPYEEPDTPEITVDTLAQSVEESVAVIVSYLQDKNYIGNGEN